MIISASEGFDADEVFARNFQMYRDLSRALQEQVAALQEAGVHEGGGEAAKAAKAAAEAAKSQQKALQTVLELEADLVRKSRIGGRGGGGTLDLDAAREEILQRLLRWEER